jgi:hypothetical protein
MGLHDIYCNPEIREKRITSSADFIEGKTVGEHLNEKEFV